MSVAQKTLQQVNLDRQRLETERARQRGEQQAEIEKLKVRIDALKADLENAQQNLLMVRSPYDGVVISLDQRTPGSVVNQGQVLCQLSQEDSQPRARLIVNEANLAKLAVAQTCAIFFPGLSVSALRRGRRKTQLDQPVHRELGRRRAFYRAGFARSQFDRPAPWPESAAAGRNAG